MSEPNIHTIDLNFLGRRGTIAAYLVPHSNGGILVETGPLSTLNNLVTGMKDYGYQVENITDVFLTHIHLDHAGAAGWWAQHGAHVHVHENGAPHLINPEKLLASAGRLYGSMMDSLWGEFIPVQSDHLTIMHDQEVTQIANLTVRALDVPGHANHHLVYLIGDACFSGDIGGIRLSPHQYLRLPMPPPDLHLEKWQESIRRIQKVHPGRIIPTHFGIYPDAEWHLQAVLDELDAVKNWMEAILPLDPSPHDFRQQFVEYEQTRAIKYSVTKDVVEGQQIANPSFMSADGILRYWNKYRKPV
jgi:glyoxylase-like metal-dependent hydrolase (beta-lactamase superfamily II)